MTQEIPNAEGHLAYLAMLVATALLIATNVEKVGGVIYRIADKRRRVAAEKRGADIAAMRRQVEYLTLAYDVMAKELAEERSDSLAMDEWAYSVQRIAIEQGVTLPPPPDFKGSK